MAFASFKAQNGWQDRTLSTIEPEITEKLSRRKRPHPDDLQTSDASSTVSDDLSSDSTHTITSFRDPARSYPESRKRLRAVSNVEMNAHSMNWGQDNHSLPQPSLVLDRSHTAEAAYPSLQDSPMFDAPSTPADEEDLNMPAMQEPSSSIISSSPPRTPPPTRRNLTAPKQAGADLLQHLGQSPRTPAVHIHHISSTTRDRPSTPPHYLTAGLLQTPGNLGLFNGALSTPGNFNLAEFCNVTPSPAPAQFGRVSMLGRTPTRSTRRTLNFDTFSLPSPSSQPSSSRGLALHLGEELSR